MHWIAAAALLFAIEPPPVNEAALASKIVDMLKPASGERAVILYDPTYYPGITERLRNDLHSRGVQTYLLTEDSVEMIQQNKEQRHDDVIATLLPLFRKSDIFVWMPVRNYVGDLRWERLVEQSAVRSVHFHWMLPYPGSRSDEQIAQDSKTFERRCLKADLREIRTRMDRLATAMRGSELHIRTEKTDLLIRIPNDQSFHFGDGDASREKARTARSIRDREIELPAGMFGFAAAMQKVDSTSTHLQQGASRKSLIRN